MLAGIEIVATGKNKCGHNKYSPRAFSRPEDHKNRPVFLEETIKRLELFYFNPLKYLIKLIRVILPASKFDTLKERFRRSERREAIKLILEVILYYLDIETLTLGYKRPNGWWTPTLKYIAKKAGIKLKRAKRAIEDLVDAGYIKITQKRLGKGTYKSLPAIKKVNIELFEDLGFLRKDVTKAQRNKQKYAIKEFNDRIREEVQKGRSPFKVLISSISKLKKENPINGNQTTSVKNTYTPSDQAEKERAIIDKAMFLHQQDPSKPFSHYYRELKQSEDSS